MSRGGDEQQQQQLELPPGFRFHPTDEELVNHYLCRKCASQPLAVPIIREIDLYKFDPWQLPGMSIYSRFPISINQFCFLLSPPTQPKFHFWKLWSGSNSIFSEFLDFLSNFLFLFWCGMQNWHFTERKNGISFRQGTENIQTVQDPTGQLEPGTGRRPGLTSTLESPRHSGLKRHSFSTLVKPPEESKPIGSCTSTASPMSTGPPPQPRKIKTWGYVRLSITFFLFYHYTLEPSQIIDPGPNFVIWLRYMRIYLIHLLYQRSPQLCNLKERISCLIIFFDRYKMNVLSKCMYIIWSLIFWSMPLKNACCNFWLIKLEYRFRKINGSG